MTVYKVSYKQQGHFYEELFLERDFACSFYDALKRSKDIVVYASLSSITISPHVLNEELITGFGV